MQYRLTLRKPIEIDMKIRFFTFIILFLALNSYSQNVELYKLDKEIRINSVYFSKSLPNLYGNFLKKQITGLSFFVDSDNNCYLKKLYNNEKPEETDLGYKIDLKIFNAIIQKIAKLEVENISYNFNIADGISYFLSFGDNTYLVRLSAHITSESDRSDPNLKKFLDVFDLAWSLIKE